MKRLILSLVLIVILPALLIADPSEHPDLQPAKQHMADVLGEFESKILEFRASEALNEEWGKRFPAEVYFVFADAGRLLNIIDKFESYKAADSAIRIAAINLSVTAEVRASDRKSLIGATFIFSLIQSKTADALPKLDTKLLGEIINAAGFEAGIGKGEQIDGIDCWLTNLRQDSDKRIMLSGYSFDINTITTFATDLAKAQQGTEAFVNSINRSTYSGIQVFRFDMSAVPGRKKVLPAGFLNMLAEIASAAGSTGGALGALRVSPPIYLENKFEIPVEISVEDLIDDEWEKIQSAITAVKADKFSVSIISDDGLQEGGHTLTVKISGEL
ncbi:MAG: PilN domain-containing protein [Candidatus Riflebacteria bacterium]|nr:PilN domain-containing protein [Candidatus Riflebacteria bacterium]